MLSWSEAEVGMAALHLSHAVILSGPGNSGPRKRQSQAGLGLRILNESQPGGSCPQQQSRHAPRGVAALGTSDRRQRLLQAPQTAQLLPRDVDIHVTTRMGYISHLAFFFHNPILFSNY